MSEMMAGYLSKSTKEEWMEDEGTKPVLATEKTTESGTLRYEIRVKGCLDLEFWGDVFSGMELSVDLSQGETAIQGQIVDQPELFGLLSRLRNKGVTLISVQQIFPQAKTEA
jgi:hypothetical protein